MSNNDDLTQRVARAICAFRDQVGECSTACDTCLVDARAALSAAGGEVERLKRLDQEAGTYVESVICMRTGFTGEPPYVGWKGLGLALNEALDERDRLRALLKEAGEVVAGLRKRLEDLKSYGPAERRGREFAERIKQEVGE